VHITSISLQAIQKCSCSTLLVALAPRCVRTRSTTLGPPAHERTTQSPLFMSPWAPATPSLAYLAIFTWLLATAICSRLYSRLTHVMYTSHATRYPAQVISCHTRSPQHIRSHCSRSLHIIR